MSTELLTKREVAEYLKVTVGTVNRLVRDGQLEALKIRKCVRFTDQALRTFLKQSRSGNGVSAGH